MAYPTAVNRTRVRTSGASPGDDLEGDSYTQLNNLTATVRLLGEQLDLVRSNALNQSLTAGGLAEGTNAATIKTVNTVNYMINGQLYTYAATDNVAITAAAVQAVSTYCLYLVSINAGGTVTVTKGTAVATDTAVLPALPASSAPIGAFKIATDGSTTYTAGTTDNGAAGITDTYYDLAGMNSGAGASISAVTGILDSTVATAPTVLTVAKTGL